MRRAHAASAPPGRRARRGSTRGLALALVVVAGCPAPSVPAPSAPSGGEEVPPAAGPPPPRRADPPLVSPAIRPATLAWDAPVLTPAQLEDAVGDDGEHVDAARARLGRFVVEFPDGELAVTSDLALRYDGHGLAGLDTDPVVSFVDDPDVRVGSLPMGGRVALRTGSIEGTLAVPAGGAEARRQALGALRTQYLVSLRHLGHFDDAPVVHAELHGVRVLATGTDELPDEVLLEGVPTTPLRAPAP